MRDFCIDARMALSSGIGTYIRNLIPLLTGFRLILLVDQPGRGWCREFEQISFPVPIYSVQEQMRYPLSIPKCDLFWSPHYNVPLMPIRAKKRVVTIHDLCHLTFGSWPEKIYAQWMFRQSLRRSHQVITVSQYTHRQIKMHFGASSHVISLGVDPEHFRRWGDGELIRKKYRLPDRFALCVGIHKPHKNIERLHQIFANSQRLKLKLVHVGKGTKIGVVPDAELAHFYSMAEVFVFPSLYEGFGLPPLEAMSCGCPTVVSRAASIPEVCGDASLYFNPTNNQEIEEAILKVTTDTKLRKQLIEKGFERVSQFTWKQTAANHAKVFEEVCRA